MIAVRNERAAWLLVLAVEAIHLAATRLIVGHFGIYSIEGELWRTALRLAGAAAYWLAFRRSLLAGAWHRPAGLSTPGLLWPLLLFLAVPLLVGNLSDVDTGVKALFAATSLAVGLREEIAFRGVIQPLLARRFSESGAIAVTTLLFTAWHIGVIPLTAFAYAQVIVAGLMFGILYARTGSLPLLIALHAIYDALWSLTPAFGQPPMAEGWGVVALGVALAGVLRWRQSAS